MIGRGPSTAAELARLLVRFAGTRVWVAGDVMLDEYVQGDAERVSPEAPVPVVHASGLSLRPGGASNVAHNVRLLGGEVELLGATGVDAAGAALRERCEALGIGCSGLLALPARVTTRKQRVLARRQQLVRIDYEDVRPPAAEDLDGLLDRMRSLPAPQAIAVSDYAKGFLTPGLLEGLARLARAAGVPLLVDPKTGPLSRYAGADLLKPNMGELERLLGRSIGEGREDLERAGGELLERSGAAAAVVTLGARGMAVFERGREMVLVESAPREVFDITGAGDTVFAVLTLAAACGAPLVAAAQLADAAAGLAVERVGTAAISREQLAGALRSASAESQKVIDLDTLERRTTLWRLQRKRIVFTNGCFDLLHAGHLALLEAAAAQGDVLVVAVNGDRSVARLKGPGRPLVPAAERAALLAAFACVDAVVVFDEDTPLETLERVQPDVLVKGGDYAPDEVVGRELVESRGGRVVLVPLLPQRSTTGLLEHLRRLGLPSTSR